MAVPNSLLVPAIIRLLLITAAAPFPVTMERRDQMLASIVNRPIFPMALVVYWELDSSCFNP